MLVLRRKAGETIVISSPALIESVLVTVMAVEGKRVQIGIDAPRGVNVARQELLDAGRTRESEAMKHD